MWSRPSRWWRLSANLHGGAGQGYALPNRDKYHRVATETDWRENLAMFERQPAGSA